MIAESKNKTDKLDAQTLAEFLALDKVPESWRPTPRVREHRTLVRLRHYMPEPHHVRQEQAAVDRGELQRRTGPSVLRRRPAATWQRWSLSAADRFAADLLCEELRPATTDVIAIDKQAG